MNATLGSSLSSPIDSPDIMHTFLPFSDIPASVATSVKQLPPMDNSVYKNQQVRSIRITTPFSASSISSATTSTTAATNYSRFLNNNIHSSVYNEASTINNNSKSLSAIPETIMENSKIISSYNEDFSKSYNEETHCEIRSCFANNSRTFANYNNIKTVTNQKKDSKLVEFSLSSVGRSFFDNDGCSDGVSTPETPPANLTPSTSSNKFSESFSTDFLNQKSPVAESNENFLYENFGGSWDLLELDLDFHEVNLDPSFGGDLEECMFFGDDPFGLLPCRPTPPDSLDF